MESPKANNVTFLFHINYISRTVEFLFFPICAINIPSHKVLYEHKTVQQEGGNLFFSPVRWYFCLPQLIRAEDTILSSSFRFLILRSGWCCHLARISGTRSQLLLRYCLTDVKTMVTLFAVIRSECWFVSSNVITIGVYELLQVFCI